MLDGEDIWVFVRQVTRQLSGTLEVGHHAAIRRAALQAEHKGLRQKWPANRSAQVRRRAAQAYPRDNRREASGER